MIEERLDRFLCNRNWGNFFQETATETLVTWTSDHNHILMNVEEKGRGIRYQKKTNPRVHYEDLWSSYEKCKEIVKLEWLDQRSWCRDNAVRTFHKAAKESLAQLKLWSINELGDRKK